jgi:hypothetical protein
MRFAFLPIVLAFLVAGCDDKDSVWLPTESGAIRLDAFDYYDGKADTVLAYKQEGVCRQFTNDLKKSAADGIEAIVQPAIDLNKFKYYYFRTTSYVSFYKDNRRGFRLQLYESPVFFRQPRIVPDQKTLIGRLDNLSIASQAKIIQSLRNENGNLKEFTAAELSSMIEQYAGKQRFDVTEWVISNLMERDQAQFMRCVPQATQLSEREYKAADQQEMLSSLNRSIEMMRRMAPKTRAY